MQRVLVVDDAPDTARLMQFTLRAQGYEVSLAFSGREALQLASAERPDAILLDVMMPEMDGLEVCRRIRATPELCATPIIMVTAKDQDEDVVAGLDAGADDYVTKPIISPVLAARLRTAIRAWQSHREIARMNEQLCRQARIIRYSQEEIIHRLVSATMYRDVETGMHVRRVGLVGEVLAKASGWSAEETENLRMAAPMHDVGKIGVPDAVLRKSGRLSPGEMEVMKTHTVIGGKILAGSDAPLLAMAADIALNHHERWDGSGYPAGLAGHVIPESARIVAIADVYDALVHHRVYRRALSEDEALAIMQQGAGSHFDALLLALFFSHFDEIRRIGDENQEQAASEACEPSTAAQSDAGIPAQIASRV
jgi:putative two-component system response regulator